MFLEDDQTHLMTYEYHMHTASSICRNTLPKSLGGRGGESLNIEELGFAIAIYFVEF